MTITSFKRDICDGAVITHTRRGRFLPARTDWSIVCIFTNRIERQICLKNQQHPGKCLWFSRRFYFRSLLRELWMRFVTFLKGQSQKMSSRMFFPRNFNRHVIKLFGESKILKIKGFRVFFVSVSEVLIFSVLSAMSCRLPFTSNLNFTSRFNVIIRYFPSQFWLAGQPSTIHDSTPLSLIWHERQLVPTDPHARYKVPV